MAATTFIFDKKNINLNGTTFNPDEILKSHLKEIKSDRIPEEFNYFNVDIDFCCWEVTISLTFTTNRVFGVTNYVLNQGFMVSIDYRGVDVFYGHYFIKTKITKNKMRISYFEKDLGSSEYRTEVFYLENDKILTYHRQDRGPLTWDLWDFEKDFDQYHYNTFKFILKELKFLN